MNINIQTAHDLHRLASVSLTSAENNLHRAEKAVEAARKAKELADTIYQASLTEQATAYARLLQPGDKNERKPTGEDIAMLRDLLRVEALGEGDHAALTRLLNAYEKITAKA